MLISLFKCLNLRNCLSYYYSYKSFLFSRLQLKFSQRMSVYVLKIEVEFDLKQFNFYQKIITQTAS
jgi:hypothetical protein